MSQGVEKLLAVDMEGPFRRSFAKVYDAWLGNVDLKFQVLTGRLNSDQDLCGSV